MSNIVKMESTSVAAMTEAEMMNVLQNSLYPGAKPESIKLVLGYCKAAGLDPMQKPVHIVPMDVKVGNSYTKRDVVMPGIGLYRTQAERTGQYAGISVPEFGPVKTMKTKARQYNNAHADDKTFTLVDGPDIEYPEWCKITVKRLLRDMTVEFTAIEYWIENYATAGKDTTAPNAMWKKRPFAQLAKCAEAQALRKAFPELGAAPTADETIIPEEDFQGATIDAKTGVVEMPKSRSPQNSAPPPAADTSTSLDASSAGGAEPDPLLSEGERAFLTRKMEGLLTDVDVKAKFGCDLAGLHKSQFAAAKAWVSNPAGE